MKGQIFIVLSIFIAIALLLLSAAVSKTYYHDDYLYNYFTNLRAEIPNVVDSALLDGDSASIKLDEFIAFSNSILAKKGYAQDITYSVSGSTITVNIYLARGGEYYKDTMMIEREVYS